MCASAPALKVFFRKYLKESSLGLSVQKSWKARKGHDGRNMKDSLQSNVTNSSQTNNPSSPTIPRRTHKDVEMGRIAITPAIEADSQSIRAPTIGHQRSRSQDSFPDSLQLQGSHIRSHSFRRSASFRRSSSRSRSRSADRRQSSRLGSTLSAAHIEGRPVG